MATEINLPGSIYKLVLSMVLGAVIGLERRHRGQNAGMRTFALISMGATLSMLVSIYIPQEYMGLKNGDPGRIAAQVVTGIGFLGAGAIIQMKGAVRGLTTAAGIWMTAAIGLAVGAGMYVISSVATALIVLILAMAETYEHTFFRGGETKIVRVKVGGIVDDLEPFRLCFARFNIQIADEFVRYDYAHSQTVLNFVILAKGMPDYVALFREISQVQQLSSITLANEVNN